MGYNGNNRKRIADRQLGFSKSANNTAERIFFGPKSFRRRLSKGIVSVLGGRKDPSARSKRTSQISHSEAACDKTSRIVSDQSLYKCECGKISSLYKSNLYCPSCGRKLTNENLITKDEAIKSKGSGCLGFILLPLMIGIGFLILV